MLQSVQNTNVNVHVSLYVILSEKPSDVNSVWFYKPYSAEKLSTLLSCNYCEIHALLYMNPYTMCCCHQYWYHIVEFSLKKTSL